jgi:hypothetical protein
MPLNKAASGPKMNGYHGEGSTGAVHGPLGRNDGVLYGRMPGGENVTHSSMWSGQGQVNMRPGSLSGFLPQGADGLVDGMDGLQLGGGGGEGGMRAAQQRQKVSDGERQDETDDDMFAMFRFKVRAPPPVITQAA